MAAALALATANALCNRPDRDYRRGDILEQLPIGPEDQVGMVGHFGPLVAAIRKQAKALYIFEQIDLPQGNLLPVSEAEHLLPQCQVALLTSTAIINQTADHLLAQSVVVDDRRGDAELLVAEGVPVEVGREHLGLPCRAAAGAAGAACCRL